MLSSNKDCSCQPFAEATVEVAFAGPDNHNSEDTPKIRRLSSEDQRKQPSDQRSTPHHKRLSELDLVSVIKEKITGDSITFVCMHVRPEIW